MLIVDADPAARALLQAEFAEAGWEVLTVDGGEAGLEVIRTRGVCAAVLDWRLPDVSGPAWLQQVLALRPGLAVIAMAAGATVEMAVEAMRGGACHFLAKPVRGKAVLKVLAEAIRAGGEVVRLGRCVTREPTLAAGLEQARQLAGSSLVAVCGPAGSGRKTLAAAMQEACRPATVQVVDLTVLPPEQVKARIDRIGELAVAGGLVLADVQCLKAADQERLAGALRPVTAPGVVVTLSDRPEKLVAKGQLARSLADLLAGAVVQLPPLAARKADLPLLAEQMLAELFAAGRRPTISAAAMQALGRYDWPGNVRQLRLVLERAGRLAAGGPVEPRHLPILQAVKRDPVPVGWVFSEPVDLQRIVDDVERHLIAAALGETKQNQAKAAELLGIPRTTLRDKLTKHGFLARDGGPQA